MKNKFILTVHIWSDGPAQAMRDYLIKKEADFMWIGHTLCYSRREGSGFTIYSKGKEIRKKRLNTIKLPMPVKYIFEFFLNLFFVFFFKSKGNCIFIGFNGLNAISGIFLKKIGKVSKVVYFSIDYTPKRFENNILNYLYHKIDQFCVKHSDETWNLNEKAMNKARMKFYRFNAYSPGYSLQKEAPMGFWKERIKVRNFEDIKKKQIVYMGGLVEKQGVQFIIKALPAVIEKIPDIKLVVAGSGAYLPILKKLSNDLGISDSVEFTGFIEDHKDIEQILTDSALAIALYEEGHPKTNFTYYTDQGKIKMYLGCGLPILLSNVPPIAKDIERNNCGVIISNDPDKIAEKIIEIISDEELLGNMRKNVVIFRDNFDWDLIFKNKFEKWLAGANN